MFYGTDLHVRAETQNKEYCGSKQENGQNCPLYVQGPKPYVFFKKT